MAIKIPYAIVTQRQLNHLRSFRVGYCEAIHEMENADIPETTIEVHRYTLNRYDAFLDACNDVITSAEN